MKNFLFEILSNQDLCPPKLQIYVPTYRKFSHTLYKANSGNIKINDFLNHICKEQKIQE